MNENNEANGVIVKQKSNKGVKIFIAVLILIILILLAIPEKYELKDGGTIVYKAKIWECEKVHSLIENGYAEGTTFKLFGIKIYDDVKEISSKTKNNEETKTDTKTEDNTTVQTTTNNIDKEQILKEVTEVYSNVYKQIANADSYGGKEDNYYKNKYGIYFTDKGLNMLSAMFEKHTPIKDILSSIFNFQNQGIRTLQLVIATNDIVVATGTYTGEGDHTHYPEYIVFKKVDGVWKIDMFE